MGLAEYPIAHAGLGSTDPRQELPLAQLAALRALELDPLLPEAHAIAGQIRAEIDYDWRASEEHHLRASLPVQLRPSCVIPMPTGAFARLAGSPRRLRNERALELDPLSLLYRFGRAYLLSFLGRYEEAANFAPDHFITQFVLSDVLARQGHFQEAIELAERALQVYGRFPMSLVGLGGVIVLTGRRDAARDILAELEAMAAKTYSLRRMRSHSELYARQP